MAGRRTPVNASPQAARRFRPPPHPTNPRMTQRMIHLKWSCRIAAIAGLMTVLPACTQFGCDAPTSDEWLYSAEQPAEGARLGPDRVRPVVRALPQAISLLATRSALPLSTAQVEQFTGSAAHPSHGGGFQAYLVRSVFPTPDPHLDVSWDGNTLSVAAAGMGCAPFRKNPIVVFLERQPEHVLVIATAAL
jgi:hypothetical protein